MPYCPRCGRNRPPIPPEFEFCPYCGAPLYAEKGRRRRVIEPEPAKPKTGKYLAIGIIIVLIIVGIIVMGGEYLETSGKPKLNVYDLKFGYEYISVYIQNVGSTDVENIYVDVSGRISWKNTGYASLGASGHLEYLKAGTISKVLCYVPEYYAHFEDFDDFKVVVSYYAGKTFTQEFYFRR